MKQGSHHNAALLQAHDESLRTTLTEGRIDKGEFCDFALAFIAGKAGVPRDQIAMDTDIIGDRLIDSIAVFELFYQLGNRYGTSVIPEDFDINDFRSIASLYDVCTK